MTSLPEEVVTRVLSYLAVSDRKSASLTCRKWLRASRHPALMRDLVVDAGAFAAGGGLPEWKRFIRTLSLSRSEMSSRQLCDLLNGCCNLSRLDLSGCNNFFMLGGFVKDEATYQTLRKQLGCVRWLGLNNIGQLTSSSLQRAAGLFVGLEGLGLSGCPIVFSSGVRQSLTSESAGNFLLDFGTVLSLHLSDLDLSHTGVTNWALRTLATEPETRLQRLRLSACQELTADGIAVVLAKQPTLRSLEIDKNRQIGCLSDRQLADASLAELRHLNTAGSTTFVGDRLLDALRTRAVQLESVDFSACDRVSSEALADFLRSAARLQSLVLARCSGVDDSVLTAVADTLDDLVHLDVSSCSRVTDEGVRRVCGRLRRLRSLRLAWLSGVTDFGLLGLPTPKEIAEEDGRRRRIPGEQFPNYRKAVDAGPPPYKPPSHSELHRSPSWTVDNKDAGVGPEFALTRLSRLRSLDLSCCQKVTRAALTELFPSSGFPFGELEDLRLLMNKHVDDSLLLNVSTGAPSLQTLHVSSAVVTDAGVAALVKRCRRLRVLEVSSCDGVTDKSLQLLAACDSLRWLNVSYCQNVSEQAADSLAHTAPQIREVKQLSVGTAFLT